MEIQIAKGDLFGFRGVLSSEHSVRVLEDICQHIKLDIVSRQRFCIAALDRQGFATEISSPTMVLSPLDKIRDQNTHDSGSMGGAPQFVGDGWVGGRLWLWLWELMDANGRNQEMGGKSGAEERWQVVLN